MNDAHWIINVLEYVTLESPANRKKVGAIIVINGATIIGQGFNSLPRTSEHETCEDANGKTRPEVLHAELKAIVNAAKRATASTEGTTLYCTIPPCPVCCGLIIEAGISRVVYKESYWSEGNLHLLTNAGISVEKH